MPGNGSSRSKEEVAGNDPSCRVERMRSRVFGRDEGGKQRKMGRKRVESGRE